jgi:aspartyl protease family protein
MRYWPLFAIAVCGVLFGWFAPDMTRSDEAPAPAAQADEPAKLDVVTDEAVQYGEGVVLTRSDDGHFYADVAIDGASTNMLVDTGASVVALTAEDADALGVAWDPGQVAPVARGANGAVYGARVTIAQMQVGTIEARGVEAIVVPEGLGISLLGQSFLSRIPNVAIERDEMVLGS